MEQERDYKPEIKWATLRVREKEIMRPVHQGEHGEYVRYYGQKYYLRKMHRKIQRVEQCIFPR